MNTDLSLIQAVTNVGQSIMSMAASAASVKSTRKQEAAILAERIRCLKSVCRARGVAELCRYSIAEMEKTLRDIEEKNYTGVMLKMAMAMLDIQYNLLCDNLRSYDPGRFLLE